MTRTILLLSLAVALAACGSGPTVEEENATVAEVSERVREATEDGTLVQPGQWVSRMSIDEIDLHGIPPQVAEQMKVTMAQTHTTCLTPEEARRPRGNFFGGSENCRYDHFTMRGGKIDAAMRCTSEGETQVLELTGTYSSDTYEMQMKTTTPAGPVTMRVEAERVGECTGEVAGQS